MTRRSEESQACLKVPIGVKDHEDVFFHDRVKNGGKMSEKYRK
jgi:hypothetical protein